MKGFDGQPTMLSCYGVAINWFGFSCRREMLPYFPFGALTVSEGQTVDGLVGLAQRIATRMRPRLQGHATSCKTFCAGEGSRPCG